jgi:hypothetical protein
MLVMPSDRHAAQVQLALVLQILSGFPRGVGLLPRLEDEDGYAAHTMPQSSDVMA